MRVTVRLFAGLREAVGERAVQLELPSGATARAALEELCAAYPASAGRAARVVFALNRDYVAAETPLTDGDELALIPPVSGGSAVEAEPGLFEVVEGPIDPMAVQRKVADPGCGAIVLFSGAVRDHSQGKPVSYLEYEAF